MISLKELVLEVASDAEKAADNESILDNSRNEVKLVYTTKCCEPCSYYNFKNETCKKSKSKIQFTEDEEVDCGYHLIPDNCPFLNSYVDMGEVEYD